MSKLLTGTLLAPDKLLVETIYNLEVPENSALDRSQGVEVSEEIIFPEYAPGRGHTWYVNPETGEQWLEEYERPLTPEEEMQELKAQNAQILLMMAQMQAAGGEG
ncbi:hypothetical protein ACFOQM_12365 [Paenibacillus sp. GCM10012307]|uniref:Uncharacterized protein n=1 Tax=Paenibacillus roseus TaxID=2798579 RepID=A0A934J3F0_9BACL|nr:hypothetical protein [Paenibacillus roseus]MBJ6362085.1 hypothetical protein [Paenibacillus roseus]